MRSGGRRLHGAVSASLVRGLRPGAALLVAAGCLALCLVGSSTSASASTLGGVATITNPVTDVALASGGSATAFTVTLPSQAACSGDTAADQYHVYSYLLRQGTAITTDNFSTGDPSEGFGLVDENGNYYGAANTAPTSGQIISVPTDFEFAGLLKVGATAGELDGGGGVWNAGIACASPSGVVTDCWNTQVTFSASDTDADGFTWTAVPGSVPSAPTSPTATAGPTAVTVVWTDPTGDGGSPITGYDVYGSTTDPPSTAVTPDATVTGANVSSATVTGLTDARTYYFVVTAVNGSGPSSPSPVVSAAVSGVATIANPVTNATVTSGASATPFTVDLPALAACSGDTATHQYHVYSYLLPQGAALVTDSFLTGVPSEGLGLVDPNGNYYGAANTAPTTGEVIAVPTNLEFAGLLKVGATAPELDGGASAVWETGIVCASPSGVVTNSWNAQVTFTASTSDPDGFTWTAVPGTIPPAPISPTASGGDGSVTVDWTDPTGDGGSPITGYDVYVSTLDPPSTAVTANATVSGAGATSATVPGLANGTTDYAVVTAVNAIGPSLASPVVSARPSTVPGPPTAVQATGANASVAVDWTDPTDDGGSPITGYDVYVSTLDPPSTAVTANATVSGAGATSATVTGLANGTTYYVVVTAINANGSSPASSAVASAVPSTVPGPPTSPTATGGNTSVTVGWNDPADDGGSPITGYDVYASTTDPPSTAGSANATVSGAGATSATVSGLADGTTLYFVVTAVNANGPSPASAPVVSAAATDTPPGAPTSATVTRADGSVTVGWTDPVSDGGSPITGYDVFCSTSSSPSNAAGRPSATAAGAGATAATVRRLNNAKKYYCVVTAFNADGQSVASPVVSTPDRTRTSVTCTPTPVAAGSPLTCTVTVADESVGSDTPTGTVTWSGSGSGTFTGAPACTLGPGGTCSVDYVPSAPGRQTISASFAGTGPQLPSAGGARVRATVA